MHDEVLVLGVNCPVLTSAGAADKRVWGDRPGDRAEWASPCTARTANMLAADCTGRPPALFRRVRQPALSTAQ